MEALKGMMGGVLGADVHHPQHCGPGRHQRNHCRLCTPLSPLILGIRSFHTPVLSYLLATCLAQLWPYLESAREGFYTCTLAPKQKSTLCPYWLSSVCATVLPGLTSPLSISHPGPTQALSTSAAAPLPTPNTNCTHHSWELGHLE